NFMQYRYPSHRCSASTILERTAVCLAYVRTLACRAPCRFSPLCLQLRANMTQEKLLLLLRNTLDEPCGRHGEEPRFDLAHPHASHLPIAQQISMQHETPNGGYDQRTRTRRLFRNRAVLQQDRRAHHVAGRMAGHGRHPIDNPDAMAYYHVIRMIVA